MCVHLCNHNVNNMQTKRNYTRKAFDAESRGLVNITRYSDLQPRLICLYVPMAAWRAIGEPKRVRISEADKTICLPGIDSAKTFAVNNGHIMFTPVLWDLDQMIGRWDFEVDETEQTITLTTKNI